MSTILRVLALVPVLAFAIAEDVTPAPAPAPTTVTATATAVAGQAPAPAAAKPAKPAKAPRPEKPHEPDLNNIDLRLTLGSAGGVNRARDQDSGVETDNFDDQTGGRIAIHVQFLRARPGGIGFVVGGGLFAAAHEGTTNVLLSSVKTTVSAVGLDLKGGFVYRPTRNWHFELPALVLSTGSATVETQGSAESDDGNYNAFALQVGGFYTFDVGIQLGLELGGQGFRANVERDIGLGVKRDFIYTGGGGFINLTGGWRF